MADTRAHAHGRTEVSEARTERHRPVESIIIDIVYYIFGAIDVLLAFRFFLKLFGANPDAGFVDMIYALSAPFMAPFIAVFPTEQVEGAVFEWSVLLAIVVYALIAWGIAALVRAITPRSSAGTVEHVEHVEEIEDHTAE